MAKKYLLNLVRQQPDTAFLKAAEIVWRHLKGGWLQPADYRQDDALAYAANRCLANIKKNHTIKSKPFL